MTDYLWPLVALVLCVLAYDLLRRYLGNAPRKEFQELLERFNAHDKGMANVLIEWRAKVLELEQKCDRVVVDAKNEIAGDLASVSDITKKNWR